MAVAIGLAVPVVILGVVWGTALGFGTDVATVFRAAVDVWLLGHGVDVTFVLAGDTATALGLPGAGAPVVVTVAVIGIGMLTVLLGRRAGRRIARTGRATLGTVFAVLVFAAASLGLALLVTHPNAHPSTWQSAVLPALVFAAGVLWGVLAEPAVGSSDALGRVREVLASDGRRATLAREAVRGAAGSVLLVIAASSVAIALLLVAHYAQVIQLYESLHGGIVGGAVLTLGEFAALPNLVVWAASWFTGTGFALGQGSHVSPVGTAVGPVPAVPVLGAIPTADSAFGFLGLLVPLVAAGFVGVGLRARLARVLDDVDVPAIAIVAVGGGATGGILLGVLAAASGGSAGPGRLVDVGPNPWLTGLVAAVELAVALAVGMAVARRR